MIEKRDKDLDILAKAITDDTVELTVDQRNKMIRIERISRYYFSKSFKFRSENELAVKIAKEYDISRLQARKEVEMCKQLYVYGNPVDWKFERALLLYSIKNNINEARENGDSKTVQREHKNLIDLVGEDKGEDEARVININVISYNPTLIGAQEIPNLDEMVKTMIAKDKEKDDKLFDEFDDVTPETK